MDIARSIVRDADLDECSEHETDPLGDFVLYDMMRVCCIFIPFVPLHGFVPLFSFICPFLQTHPLFYILIPLFYLLLVNIDSSLFYKGLVSMRALQICCASREASIRRLKDRLESEANALKKFKELSRTLGQEVIDLNAKLSGMTHQTNELVKENANLKFEVVVLHEQMGKVKEKAIEEYQVSQPYFNEMRGYYGDNFEDFHKQAVLMFPGLNFF